ncbi:MAG: methionyl-tRNA formyltransferase [Gemmataceae bacterium]
MRLVMMGTGLFAEPTFEALLASRHQVVGLVTQPDRAVGEKRGSTRQTGRGMKEIALERGVPVYQPDSVNTPEGVATLREWGPDLLVVAAYGQILSKDVLEAAPGGGINVHASLLPRYRGAAPIHWAIYHGETETGVTIIRMSTALDAGDMLAQDKIAIGPEETSGEVEARLGPLGAKTALGVIEQIEAGTTRGIKQDKSLVTKAPKLTKEHGLIDWSRSAAQVVCQVRAMQPWPTAYSYLHEPGAAPLRVIVWRARVSDRAAAGARAGAVIEGAGQPGLFVAAGQGSVEVLELQPSGKKRMAAADFLRGRPITSGMRFGPEQP